MARIQRRRLVGDAVELEQGKEAALLEQLEETVAELEGSRIDEEALGRMTPEDADVVRRVLAGESPGGETAEEEEEPYDDWLEPDADPEAEARELQAEIGRLEGEIARSRRVREAVGRCLSAPGSGELSPRANQPEKARDQFIALLKESPDSPLAPQAESLLEDPSRAEKFDDVKISIK